MADIAAERVKLKGQPLAFFAYKQGAGLWVGLLLFLVFAFLNPRAETKLELTLWLMISPVFAYGLYLAFTQLLPAILAPLFESHFAVLKDISVSVWVPVAIGAMAIFSGIRGVQFFGVDVDMTLIEWGVALHFMIAFAIDIFFGTTFVSLKNRLANEGGLARMPG